MKSTSEPARPATAKSRGPWLLFALVVVLIGAGIAGLASYDYVMHDARFCLSCHDLHDEHYASWQASSHSEVTCHGCHVQSFADNVKQLVVWVTTRPTEIEGHAVVDHTRCGACHLSDDDRWRQVAETAGHRLHFGEKQIECVECHSEGVHNIVRPSDSCTNCHEQTVMGVAGDMARVHCTACHRFLAPEGEIGDAVERPDCLECHEAGLLKGLAWTPDAPMKFPCTQCHEPHKVDADRLGNCVSCHATLPGLHEVAFHADCLGCHPAHSWKPEPRVNCEACHVDKLEHYPGIACFDCHSFRSGSPAAVEAD